VNETDTIPTPTSVAKDAPAASAAQSYALPHKVRSDAPFFIGMCLLGGFYIFMIFAMLIADAFYTSPGHLLNALNSPEIRYSIKLSLISCTLTALFSLWVAVPLGYLMSRYDFPLKHFLDAVLDIPIVLPPLVVGLSLLILSMTPIGRFVEDHIISIRYAIPSVILAQFMVAAAFSVRTMRQAFDQITPRQEQVALTLGCTRSQAFFHVVLPEARRGMITAFTLAWARALGEFGPILIFSGSTRMRTEVLSVSVYLEFSVGQLNAAVAVSLLMVMTSILVLVSMRTFGFEKMWKKVS
jgi:molybdate transport system permease protein